MAYVLVNIYAETIFFQNDDWSALLQLAATWGWVPVGSSPPPLWVAYGCKEGEWSGSYLAMDQEIVLEDDAINMADALERALPDIPDHPVPQRLVAPKQLRGRMVIPDAELAAKLGLSFCAPSADGDVPSAYEQFGGETRKKKVVELIAFCRRGAFCIL